MPRPRRFGKSLNLSMLKYFFNDPDSKELFNGLNIYRDELFHIHQGRYPVIFLTFKDINFNKLEDSYDHIKGLIVSEYNRLDYLLMDNLRDDERKSFIRIKNSDGTIQDYTKSILLLTKLLYEHHNQKVVLLIDEYDTPVHTAFSEGYYDEMIRFLRNVLSPALKDNIYLFKGVLTGILRVARESIFSGLNNLAVYTILSKRYNTAFGFTDKETECILEDFKLEHKFGDLSEWYNGYLFGGEIIYNPWSVLNYINYGCERRPYWINTSSNDLIKYLIRHSTAAFRYELEVLIHGNCIKAKIDENVAFEELREDESNIYGFLLFSGYLKAEYDKSVGNEAVYNLTIPNIEVRLIYERKVSEWINRGYESNKLQEMLKALVTGEIKIFERYLQDFVVSTLSYFNTSRNIEAVYQAFILGLLVNLNTHHVKSNRESGFGRYDIMAIPKDKRGKGIIMELKTIDDFEGENKESSLNKALKQIEDMRYEDELRDQGVRDILKLGVTFDGKRAWVKHA